MGVELYKKYRPKELKHIIGQTAAVDMLNGMLATEGGIPHTVMLTGPSGVGKTTIARILRTALGCTDHDFREINCAEARGIDMVREIDAALPLAPMGGPCRAYLLDEVHQLTKDAQSALLKILEDTPAHIYFFLCTTDPDKVLATIRTRATVVGLEPLDNEELEKLLQRVAKRAGFALDEEVQDAIIDAADGSARQALVFLNQILQIEGTEEQLATIRKGNVKQEGIELCRAIFGNKSWGDVAKVLKAVKGDPESLRYAILGYATSILLGGGGRHARLAFLVIDAFSRNFYDSKKAGLVAACYEVVVDKKGK